MDYLRVHFDLRQDDPWADVLSQELADRGYETFQWEGGALAAYIRQEDFDQEVVDEVLESLSLGEVAWGTEVVAHTNWNQEWEKNYPMIDVDGRVLVHAGFHNPQGEFEHTIRIDPKMSFGTGHHATTKGMIRAMLDIDFHLKQVLDMGSGTGILAILAEKLGASEVLAVEIDDWVVENARENATLNACRKIEVLHASEVPSGHSYQIVLANINRNVLCLQMPDYEAVLEKGGTLLVSGFHPQDLEVISSQARKAGLAFVAHFVENDWVCAQYVKP